MSGNQKLNMEFDTSNLPEEFRSEDCIQAYYYSKLWCLGVYRFEDEREIIEENILETRKMLDEGEYSFANLPEEYWNESCCRAYVFGMQERLLQIDSGEKEIVYLAKASDRRVKPRYSISIACHNNLALTKKCLESIYLNSRDYEIIVIDNASTDGTTEYLEESESQGKIRLMLNEKNEGFIKAHNKSLEHANGLYFIVLNNDTEVCPNWLEMMDREFLNNPKLGICGVKGFCCSLDKNGNGFVSEHLEYIEASCLMIPVWLARQEVLFSYDYEFGYCEDSDLSLRLREKGYQIKSVDIPVIHHHASTAKIVKKVIDIEGYHLKNHIVFHKKWENYLNKRTFEYKILIHRQDAIGDVLLLTPIIRELKSRYADLQITVSSGHPVIFKDNPDVYEALQGYPADIKNYDKVFNLDLAYERTPKKHILKAYSDALGVDLHNPEIKVYPSPADYQKAREILSSLQKARTVVFHPDKTAWNGRNWNGFSIVANILLENNWNIVLIGGGSELVPYSIDLRRRLTFHETAAIINLSDLFIGIDSMPMHLAQSFLIPTVAVFGCINPKYRLLDVPFIQPVQAENVGCLGCHHYLPAPRTSSLCYREKVYCMDKLRPETVIDKINKVLLEYKMFLETSKIRDFVLKYCEGIGIDIGCGRDKIKPDAIGFDFRISAEVDVAGDASKRMPFVDGEFDYVFSSHCLEDIFDTKTALTEWVRILKPEGYIILYIPHKDLYKGYNADHKHEFVNYDIEHLLIENGCEIIENKIDSRENCYSFLIVAKKGVR